MLIYFCSDEKEEQMVCHKESLTTNPRVCIDTPCRENCDAKECDLCWNCLSQNQRFDLHLAYRETKNKGAMKRVFPPSKEALSDDYLQSLSKANRWMTKWFLEMCKKDSDFC